MKELVPAVSDNMTTGDFMYSKSYTPAQHQAMLEKQRKRDAERMAGLKIAQHFIDNGWDDFPEIMKCLGLLKE